ncbi:UDP-glucuronosyltransferase [Amycolatopsis orientalis]|uniref:UDP-glucuronosyltransferase n=1 Tax=Amycolatopsis orientalis TaxID=31958 RepID=A0A193C1W2_AMYOR|nr:nucleotide disphospho-sugar-binding domain-containing protein [Amycolatopsis orientalis]ANN18388.1 UDP-glucuronosyltransferase [Amycolatopsis orientalis]
MSRFLLVVPPLTGHVAPLRAVAAELLRRGHDVAWCGPEPTTSELTRAGRVHAAGDALEFAVERRPEGLRGFAALKFLWERYLIPLADAMVPGVEKAVADFRPDVVLADQQAFAGALVASRRAVPWVTSASTSTELADPLGALPKIAAWVDGLQDDLRARHHVSCGDLRFSPELVLAFTTVTLTGPITGPGAVRFVGPALAPAPPIGFSWDRLDGRPLVLATLGTANAALGRRFLSECVDALAGMPEVQGLVVDPTGELLSDEVLLAKRIPQAEVVRQAAAVICHGGHNTVSETLACGLPLVIAPIRDDQSMLAQQVEAAGAGLRLRFDRVKAPDIRRTITDVLTEPAYAAAAARVRASFAAAGGVGAAADHLESLLQRG